MKVFVWSVPDFDKPERFINYMLSNDWAGQGWGEINLGEINSLEEFVNRQNQVYGGRTQGDPDMVWKYLRGEERIKSGDVIILKKGYIPIAIGIVEGEYEYRQGTPDIPNGVPVKWIYHRGGEPIDFPSLKGYRTSIAQVHKKEILQSIQEILNAYKFRGEDRG